MRRVVLLALPLVTGCFLQPSCGPETRQLDARAQISAPGDPRIERMDVSLGQSKASRDTLTVVWRLTAVDLQFHVQSLRIVERTTDSVLVAVPVPAFHLAGSIRAPFADSRAADGVYDLILRNQAKLVIETDIPGRERITQALQSRTGNSWVRAICD